MKLYHGTFDRKYERIVNNKILTGMYEAEMDDATSQINYCLNEYSGEDNVRDGAIFFFDSCKYQGGYDHILVVDVEKLNKYNLFVADFRTSTDIYSIISRGSENRKLKNLCKKYVKNFMTYEEYLKNKEKIEIPEFLYFGEINFINIELMDEFELAFG